MPGYAVVVDDVAVSYGTTRALGGVELRVPHGTTLGVLGPNGAGKTTLIRVLTTLIRPDRGRVRIDGIDALAQPGEVRRRIGVTGQYAGLDEFLTTFENLELVNITRRSRSRASPLLSPVPSMIPSYQQLRSARVTACSTR
jgi:ABC-2 type transport system ATP-binding protein